MSVKFMGTVKTREEALFEALDYMSFNYDKHIFYVEKKDEKTILVMDSYREQIHFEIKYETEQKKTEIFKDQLRGIKRAIYELTNEITGLEKQITDLKYVLNKKGEG